MSQFIVVTRIGGAGTRHPGMRVAVSSIIAYYPDPTRDGQTHVFTLGGEDGWWTVSQSCEEIDRLIAGPGMYARVREPWTGESS